MSAGRAALAGLRRVRVGSTNAPKLEAVRRALGAYAADVVVEGVEVASGVANQPVGFDEIVAGARNRAQAALRSGECELAVGIEDGLVQVAAVPGGPLNVGCAAVTDGKRTGLGFSAGFAYPPACAEPAFTRREPVGELFDRLWQERRGEAAEQPSGRGLGNVGRLSLGVLTRAEYARHAVVCAMLRFLHPDLYPDERSAG